MSKTALLVVDVQNALVLGEPYNRENVISNIKKLVQTSRDNEVEVIYIQHSDEIGGELEENCDGWQIYKEVAPISGEKIINKNYNSAFKGTTLKEYLDSRGINKLIITGMQTEYCIDTTVKVAFEYGFEIIVPEETNTTFNNGNMLAKDLYEYYNFNIFKNRFASVESMDNTIARLKQIGN